MRLCTHVEDKAEWGFCLRALESFLSLESTKAALSQGCIAAVKDFANVLMNKESRLANCKCMFSTNSLDASTTSPVESMNSIVKFGKDGVSSNMNLSKSLSSVLHGTDDRMNFRNDEALRQMSKSSCCSRAPTKDDVNKKGQGLLDASYDVRLHFKAAQGEHHGH